MPKLYTQLRGLRLFALYAANRFYFCIEPVEDPIYYSVSLFCFATNIFSSTYWNWYIFGAKLKHSSLRYPDIIKWPFLPQLTRLTLILTGFPVRSFANDHHRCKLPVRGHKIVENHFYYTRRRLTALDLLGFWREAATNHQVMIAVLVLLRGYLVWTLDNIISYIYLYCIASVSTSLPPMSRHQLAALLSSPSTVT